MYPATHATVQVARQAAYAAAMSETPVIKFPGVFDANTADEAMRIILTAEDPDDPASLGDEASYFADLIATSINLSTGHWCWTTDAASAGWRRR
jgi:hypothetical protein